MPLLTGSGGTKSQMGNQKTNLPSMASSKTRCVLYPEHFQPGVGGLLELKLLTAIYFRSTGHNVKSSVSGQTNHLGMISY